MNRTTSGPVVPGGQGMDSGSLVVRWVAFFQLVGQKSENDGIMKGLWPSEGDQFPEAHFLGSQISNLF